MTLVYQTKPLELPKRVGCLQNNGRFSLIGLLDVESPNRYDQ